MTVAFQVDIDGWTGGLQVEVGNESGGRRLAGPKYNGSSTHLLKRTVDSVLAQHVLDLLKGHDTAAALVDRNEQGALQLSLAVDSSSLTVAGADNLGPFRHVKTARLDERDVASICDYMREARA